MAAGDALGAHEVRLGADDPRLDGLKLEDAHQDHDSLLVECSGPIAA